MNDYSTEFLCTYLLIDEEHQEDLYRAQYLQAFKLQQWDDKIINISVNNLFNYLNNIFNLNYNCVNLQKCHINNILNKLRNSNDLQLLISICGGDDLSIFQYLFKFELFQYSHAYFCKIISNFTLDNTPFIDINPCIEINSCINSSPNENIDLINAYNILFDKL